MAPKFVQKYEGGKKIIHKQVKTGPIMGIFWGVFFGVLFLFFVFFGLFIS
jgi:uncharacterized membrane protein